MMMVAIAAGLLIAIAIYSLQQVKAPVWTSQLSDLSLQATLRQDLPHFEYVEGGKTLNPETFKGHWTLLTFWAYWCAPCLEEMPALNSLGQQWQGANFEILTVNTDDTRSDNFEAAHNFLSEQNIALPTVFDKGGMLKKAFGVDELPRHFLVNPEGKIVWQAKGAFRWSDTKARDQLLHAMGDEAFPEGNPGLGEGKSPGDDEGVTEQPAPDASAEPTPGPTTPPAK